MKKIVVVGSLNVDYVVNVDHMPISGETILSDTFDKIPGGKGANQAYALGIMGAEVSMIGAVGNDDNGKIELESLQNADVDVSHILQLEEGNTGIALITVDLLGNNSIIVVQGANKYVSTDYIDRSMHLIEAADIVLLQLEIPLDTIVHVAKAAKKLGKTVILDPAPVHEKLSAELLENVDYIKPNEVELATLTEMPDANMRLEEACNCLLDSGVSCVLASLGSKGVYVQSCDGKSKHFSVENVEVVDSTAAGDSFIAAFVYAISNDRDIDTAIQFANCVSTIVVQRKGAQSSFPKRDEIMEIWNHIALN